MVHVIILNVTDVLFMTGYTSVTNLPFKKTFFIVK